MTTLSVKAMLHKAIFLATCNATMTNKKPFKLQRGCYTQATCLAMLQKVEGHSTFLATRNATIAVAKWGVTCEVFLATCNATKLQEKLLHVTWPLDKVVAHGKRSITGRINEISPWNDINILPYHLQLGK